MASPGEKRTLDSSIVDMEMEIVDDDDMSDYDTSFAGGQPMGEPTSRGSGSQQTQSQFADDVKRQMGQTVTSYIWQSGTQQAKKAFNMYGNIDVLRPYFNVEPHEVRARLLYSLLPQKPTDQRQIVYRELYGPTMIVFTLIALLLFQMKTSDHSVQEGTLMGSAFGVCFGYWLGVSSLMWVLAYICNTHITMLQILSLLGYGLFGHCVVVFSSTMIHTVYSHTLFYTMWAVIGGLSTLKMVSVIISRTSGKTQRLIVCGAVSVIHLLFLLYLHFAYHRIVEEISSALEQDLNPVGRGDYNSQNQNMLPRDVDKIAKKIQGRVTPGGEKVPREPPLPAGGAPNVQDVIRAGGAPYPPEVVKEGGSPAINDTLVGHVANETLQQKSSSTNETVGLEPDSGQSHIMKAIGNRAAKVHTI